MGYLTNEQVEYYESLGAKCSDCIFGDDCDGADDELCNDFGLPVNNKFKLNLDVT